MFAFGIDHTVVNVTKDAIWIREAALPDTANTTRPNPQWLVQEMFGGGVQGDRPAATGHTIARRPIPGRSGSGIKPPTCNPAG